jgi:hypothetical protein
MILRHKPLVKPEDNEDALVQSVANAVRSLGWLAPETEEEVATTEGGDGQAPRPLPPALRDPYALLDRQDLWGTMNTETELVQDAEVVEELARAAREGRGKISDDVEDLMRRDRDAAEHRGRDDNR